MKRLTYFAAAALAVGSMGIFGCNKEDTNIKTAPTRPATTRSVGTKVGDAMEDAAKAVGHAADKTGTAIVNAGEKVGDAVRGTPLDAGRVRSVLSQVTNAAVTKSGLDDMVERFSKADRDRIGTKKIDAADVDGIVDQLTKDWKAKYNADIKDADPAMALPDTMITVATSTKAGETPTATGGTVAADSGADTKMATVTIAAGHDLPELQIPMAHEGIDSWVIDVPDGIDAAKLHANVMKHLKMMADMQAKWPADANDAYAALSHHVLMAVMDKD